MATQPGRRHPSPAQRRWFGTRIRDRRRQLSMTQAVLAEQVGISASYLNLIEANKRPVGPHLLPRLAQALGVTPGELNDARESRLLADLEEVAGDPVLAETSLPRQELRALLSSAPGAASALSRLYRAYRETQEQVRALSEQVSHDPVLADATHDILTRITSIRSFAEILRDYRDLDDARRQRFSERLVAEAERLASVAADMFGLLEASGRRPAAAAPPEEVDDLLHDHVNHFPDLERAAETSRPEMDASGGLYLTDLLRHLERRHQVQVVRLPAEELAPRSHEWDGKRRELRLSLALPLASSRFQTARLVGRLEAAATIDAVLATVQLTSDASVERAREALLSYFAACLLMPYERFQAASDETRHDIELLQQRFGASWEQVCHRLTTMRRPGHEGLPFHFLRTDIAGNVSKRFFTAGLPLPRYAGICPRWAVHAAFLTPDRVVAQMARTEDGQNHLFIARTAIKRSGGHGAPQSLYSVMLACDATFAPRIVYADGLAGGPVLPVGITCRQCGREDCSQRANPQTSGMAAVRSE